MLKINGTTITLTRGDTLRATLEITDAEGNTYTPSEGDTIRFAMKKSYSDSACLIEKVNGTWVKQTESPFDTNTHYRKG